MDILNRKALADVRVRLAEVEAERRRLDEDVRDFRAKLSWEESLRNELATAKQELEVKNAVLLERLDLLTSGLLDKPSAPQTWTEDAEDAEYLFRTGQLDKSEFEAALEAAGFSNTEIAFDSGSLPRI